ncbi:MAG: ribosome assembly RNA-binding protein YhbY [Desulfobacteraceae bacterium]|nr:ribosome assembly RNA-binding protein YhbY [Desulfobacteraceae bacterium]
MTPQKRPKAPVLTGKQARHLRGLGHHLKPTAMVGKEGITGNVIAAVEAVLTVHELIKVRIQENCPLDRSEAAARLGEQTAAAVAQVLGKTFLLYRPNPDLPEDKRIKLP